MIDIKYDWNSDVLYVSLDGAKPAFVADEKDGLLYRISYGDNSRCGITVLDFSDNWLSKIDQLSEKVADFLSVPIGDVTTKIFEALKQKKCQSD